MQKFARINQLVQQKDYYLSRETRGAVTILLFLSQLISAMINLRLFINFMFLYHLRNPSELSFKRNLSGGELGKHDSIRENEAC